MKSKHGFQGCPRLDRVMQEAAWLSLTALADCVTVWGLSDDIMQKGGITCIF